MKGKFITFEGIDGSGKTTQINLLEQKLIKEGISPLILREPGGTRLSERIRQILLDRKNINLSSVAESLLFVAARAQLVSDQIKPALEQGKYVICDRFIDSTVAYQGYGRRLNVEYLEQLNNYATDNIHPDITILLDINPEKAALRKQSDTPDRMEDIGIDFFLRVQKGYYEIANRHLKRCVIIDGNLSENKVFELVMKEVNKKLSKGISCN